MEAASFLTSIEQRLRARIDDLCDRLDEVRTERDLALHELWKTRLNEDYWRERALHLEGQKESGPESPPESLPSSPQKERRDA